MVSSSLLFIHWKFHCLCGSIGRTIQAPVSDQMARLGTPQLTKFFDLIFNQSRVLIRICWCRDMMSSTIVSDTYVLFYSFSHRCRFSLDGEGVCHSEPPYNHRYFFLFKIGLRMFFVYTSFTEMCEYPVATKLVIVRRISFGMMS